MKKTIKLLAMLLALVMLFACVSGCSSANGETTASEQTAAASDANTEATDAEPAAEGDFKGTIKFGGVGPLTGDAAIYGISGMNGAQIAVDEINAAGGINGFKVEFQKEDDVADGESSVNAYNSLMDWGMNILLGPVTSGAGIAVSTEAYNDRMFLLTGSASSADVTAGKDNVFQLCFTDPNQGTGSAEYIAANMSTDYKIAVIYRNDDAYSQGVRDNFVAKAGELGLNIVYEGTFTNDTATDFSVQLTAAQAAEADFVYLPIYYQPASVILNQSNAMGYAPIFFGIDGMDGILTLEGFDTSLAEGVMLLTPFSAKDTDEKTVNFVAAYEAAYGETPNQFAADFYDCVYALKQALENINYDGTLSNEELCDAMIEQFTTMTFDGVTGSGMTWSTIGEVSKMPKAVVIENGEYESAN